MKVKSSQFIYRAHLKTANSDQSAVQHHQIGQSNIKWNDMKSTFHSCNLARGHLKTIPKASQVTVRLTSSSLQPKSTLILDVFQKPSYFNLDPKTILASGFCTTESAVLSLGFSGNGGSLTLTFKKVPECSWVCSISLRARGACFPASGRSSSV